MTGAGDHWTQAACEALAAGDLALARALFPRLFFDRAEPFLPEWIGVSILRTKASSPSFRRTLEPPRGGAILEYAIYWDWDIQHLYDLEHVWLFLDSGGALVDAEASFHGKWLKSLLPGGGNIEDGRLALHSQPGKHAFSPDPLLFRLLPDSESCCLGEAGKAGAELPWPLQGRIEAKPEWDAEARAWLSARAFRPTWDFVPWEPAGPRIIAWVELDAMLPRLFADRIKELEKI